MITIDLSGKVVVVTGGASGIGKACASMAAQAGAKVAILDVQTELAEDAAREIRERQGQAVAFELDVQDSSAVERIITSVERKLGPIGGVVASAGVSPPHPAAGMPDDIWSRAIDINLTGMFRTLRPIGERMINRGSGSIVAIASIDGMGGHAARAHYTASKHGVIGLVRSLAIEWGRFGVRVNAIAPGIVDTPLVQANIPQDHLRDVMTDRVPMGRLSTAVDQAGPCTFLLSDLAAYVNGAVLAVDGGTTAGYLTHWNGADLASRKLLDAGLYGAPVVATKDPA